MEPLSCANCLHNPLQLGAVGTAFGYCTFHRVVLHEPHHTTCGELLRKDLLAARGTEEQRIHRRVFRVGFVQELAAPRKPMNGIGLVSELDGDPPRDDVFRDVTEYGLLPSKVATLAALWSRIGVRAEVAMLSLGRAYFANCIKQRGKWTAGLHLARQALNRLADDPSLAAEDLRAPVVAPLTKAIDLAKWAVVAQRVAMLVDVGKTAQGEGDPVAQWVDLGMAAIATTAPGSAKSLIGHLRRKKRSFEEALDPRRYRELAQSLHLQKSA
jgi:hypothetical protein